MRRFTATRNIARVACVALAAAVVGPMASASEPTTPAAHHDSSARFVPLGIGKSFIVDLPRDAKDVLVANPAIANAVVRSTRRAYIIGVAVGQTNVFFFDAQGRQIAGFDIAVTRDLNGVRGAIRQVLPKAQIKVEGVGADSVMLSGTAANPGEAQQAFDVVAKLVGSPDKVVNNIEIKSRDQVMLRVTVAEVQRDVLKQFGINLNGSIAYGDARLTFNVDNPFGAGSDVISNTSIIPGWVSGGNSVNANIRAMERVGVVRTLAEPNLTTVSGESANFLAGGEFPIATGRTCDNGAGGACTTTIQFKKFGVGLNFTPVVLSEGRISLKVLTEVSELTNEGAIVQQGLVIPALKVRRAETTVELPSGGALALAGMIQEQTKQAITGLPGAQQIPILGTLFRSRDYINRQTELVVIVTPYVVRPVAQRQLSRPDDGFADANDPNGIFLGKLNRIYGTPGTKGDPRRAYHGSYGFILD